MRNSTPPELAANLLLTRCKPPAVFLAAALMTGAHAHGAEPAAESPPILSLKDLVQIPIPKISSASKWEQTATAAPSSVTVIGADEIKQYGYRTLADVLAATRGLYISYDRNYSFLGMRGFNRGDYNNRLLVLVDGHRINNNISDSGSIGTELLLDIDLIDQVEVIRGPAATFYGNNAFFGVINVTTRRPSKKPSSLPGFGAEVSAEAASYDTYKGRATWGRLFENDLELLFSGSILDSDGQEKLYFREFDSPASNNGIARRGDGDSYKSGFGTIRWRDFTLQGGFITREKGNPTAQYFTGFNDPRHGTTDDRGYADLSFAHEFGEDMKLSAKVYYDRYEFSRDQPGPDLTFPLNREEQTGEWWGSELQFTSTLWENHKVILGGEYRDDFNQQRRNFDVDPYALYADTQRSTYNYGLFAQGDFAILPNLHMNAGVRYDRYGDNDPAGNPRIAFIFNPAKSSTFKAIYGTAFRAPNFFERTFNPDLVPETIRSFELAYEQQIGKNLRSSVSLFHNRIDDLISLRADPVTGASTYQNILGADAQGVEAEIEGFWSGGVRTRLSYSYADTEDRETFLRLTDSPAHLAKLNLSVPLQKDKIFANLEFQYTSSRKALTGPEASGFGIINFTLFSQNLLKGLDMSASVYNLLDRDYRDPATLFHSQGLLERDGRSFRGKVTWRF